MPRTIHIHVEEPSMEAFLREFLPRRLDPAVPWKVIDYGSKQQLLARLPTRMAGYAHVPVAHRPKSLILVDRDEEDCHALKQRLEQACADAGLPTRTAVPGAVEVVNRVVCEELEAWFFGDAVALDEAWRGMGRAASRAAYRDPDGIRGGTHEALLRELRSAGHLKGQTRLPKIDTARTMGGLLIPERNSSSSFQQFWTGLNALVAAA